MHHNASVIFSKLVTCQKYSFASFFSSVSLHKQLAKSLKGRSKSSQEWLIRQLSDPYVEKAKMQNYRCRSAFKLLEIDDKYHVLKPGQCVVDCGAAPGSWTQVLVHRTNSRGTDTTKPIGKVVGIDRLPVYPIEGAVLLSNMDFTLSSSQTSVLQALNNERVDVVVSDMAPNATGLKSMDHENIIMLAYAALRFAIQVSRVDASLLLKIWDGGDANKLETDMLRFYQKVKCVKPAASRTDSAEQFLLGRGFKGLQTGT